MTSGLAYSALSAGSAVLMLALLTLAGHTLGVEDYGTFTYAITVATIAEVFMDFGLHQITVRAVARDRTVAGRFLYTSLSLKIVPGVAMVVIFGGAVWLLRADETVRLASLLMLISATMRSYLLTAKGILLGLERFGEDALVTAADRVLLLACCGAALLLGGDVITLAIVFVAVRVVSAALAVAVARWHSGTGTVDRALWRSLPAEAIPVGVFLLVLNLYNRIDTLMLGSMAGDRATGLYGAAYPLYEGLTYATAVISSVLVPRFSRLWDADRSAFGSLLRKSLAATALLALAVAAVGWPLADIGIRVAFGADFADAGATLRVLLLGLPFVYVIWVLHGAALAAHRTSLLVWVTAIGTLLNVGLNSLWIPRYAQQGAAAATVLSEVVAMGLLLYGLRETFLPSSRRLDDQPTR